MFYVMKEEEIQLKTDLMALLNSTDIITRLFPSTAIITRTETEITFIRVLKLELHDYE